jgi:hypothetical protein
MCRQGADMSQYGREVESKELLHASRLELFIG